MTTAAPISAPRILVDEIVGGARGGTGIGSDRSLRIAQPLFGAIERFAGAGAQGLGALAGGSGGLVEQRLDVFEYDLGIGHQFVGIQDVDFRHDSLLGMGLGCSAVFPRP
jgi:hypothetical protein